MKTAIIALCAALSLASAPAAAKTGDAPEDAAPEVHEGDRVLDTVYAFMAGLEARDAEGMRALVTEPGFLAMVQERDGPDRVALTDLDSVITSLAGNQSDLSEPLYDPWVNVDGPVAMVWAYYDFLRDGELSHCGVDVFTLLRVDGEWKIATITYSHLEEGCPLAP